MARSQAVASGVGQPVSAQPVSVLAGTAAFGAPLLVLALGHMLSNMLRTLPAIATGLDGCMIVNGGSYGTQAVTLSPNAADMIRFTAAA